MENRSVADIAGPWLETGAESSPLQRCRDKGQENDGPHLGALARRYADERQQAS